MKDNLHTSFAFAVLGTTEALSWKAVMEQDLRILGLVLSCALAVVTIYFKVKRKGGDK